MRFAIITTQPPRSAPDAIMGGDADPADAPFSRFAEALSALTPSSERTRAGGPHHWFIDLSQDTDLFAAVVDSAKKHGVPHEVLFLGEEPVRYSFAPAG